MQMLWVIRYDTRGLPVTGALVAVAADPFAVALAVLPPVWADRSDDKVGVEGPQSR